MAEKGAAKTRPRIIIKKKQEGNKKSRKATQYSFALHLLSQGSLEKSRGEEKKKVMWNNSPGIKVEPLLYRNTSRTTHHIVQCNKLTCFTVNNFTSGANNTFLGGIKGA